MSDFLNSLPVQYPDGTIRGADGAIQVRTAPTRQPAPTPTERRATVTDSQEIIFARGRKWYRRINSNEEDDEENHIGRKKARGILNDFTIKDLEGKLIVCLMPKKDVRLYTVFDSHVEFAMFQQSFEIYKRSFYEIAFGDYLQKPHFDIDIDLPDPNDPQAYKGPPVSEEIAERLKDTVIRLIIEVFNEKGVVISLQRDVLVYTSHGIDKRSYHIIINNHCHAGCKEAKALYDLVIQRFPADLKIYVENNNIDSSVYSPKQQFRILGSTKIGKNRTKKFSKEWIFEGNTIVHEYIEVPDTPEYESVLQLEESLLTFTNNCSILPSLLQSDPNAPNVASSGHSYTGSMENINKELANKAFKLLIENLKASGLCSGKNLPFSVLSIAGINIALKRHRPTPCGICRKIHEHENPYLIVAGEGATRNVYFHCRRAPRDRKQYIGKIDDIPDTTPPTGAEALPGGSFAGIQDGNTEEVPEEDNTRSGFHSVGGFVSDTGQLDEFPDEFLPESPEKSPVQTPSREAPPAPVPQMSLSNNVAEELEKLAKAPPIKKPISRKITILKEYEPQKVMSRVITIPKPTEFGSRTGKNWK